MQLLFSGAIPTPQQVRGVTAVLGIVDADTGEILHLCEYGTPPELRAPNQKMQFTGLLHDGRPDICLLPHRDRSVRRLAAVRARGQDQPSPGSTTCTTASRGTAGSPSRTPDSRRWTTCLWTGISSTDGICWKTIPEARRIDPDLDYRRLPDTKPHRLHPNHLWARNGELWATGLKIPGAVHVLGDRRRLTFETGMPNDGPARRPLHQGSARVHYRAGVRGAGGP